MVLMRLDLGIMRSLRSADMRGLLLYAMPGLTLMQPGGNLLEIMVAVVGAIVASRLIILGGFFGAAPDRPIPRSVPDIAE